MIKLGKPDIGEEEFVILKEVLDSGNLVQGKYVSEFEETIAAYLGVEYAVAVSSGTAGLHLSLASLEIESGDEVLAPDFTFPATTNVIELVKATTKFIDINLDDYCMDAEKLQQAITKNTKAILPVHEFGQSADMDKILEIARENNLLVIEDAACALGTEYKGKKTGTMGDIGVFSLHPRKAITTGEGGIVVTNNRKIAERIKLLRNHGIEFINGKAQFVVPGYNYRMTDFQAAIGCIQIKKLNYIIEKRRKLAEEYDRLLANNERIKIPQRENHIYQTYHILLDEKLDRDKIIETLKKNDIESNIGAYCVHKQPYYYNKYKLKDEDYPMSVRAYQNGLALPLHQDISLRDIEKVTQVLLACINGKDIEVRG